MSEPQAAVAAAQLRGWKASLRNVPGWGTCLPKRSVNCRHHTACRSTPLTAAVYWFYMFRIRTARSVAGERSSSGAVREGLPVIGGYIKLPLYREPVFQQHAFFAGRWPVKEMGLTSMDFTRHKCPEAEEILATGIRVMLNEHMTEGYVLSVAAAIKGRPAFCHVKCGLLTPLQRIGILAL